jgi:hypothetical protein
MKHFDLQRFERWLWYLFVATAAWQTRLILWKADAQFIEWRSLSLYASDVLMAALLVCALVRARGWFVRTMDSMDWVFGFFIAAAVLSLGNADQLTVGVGALLRFVQGFVFYLYLRHWAWKRFDADMTAVAFVGGALLQSAIGIAQYVMRHDVGLRWLGEPVLRTDMRGVAVFYDLRHIKVLRAYGTFPHPNVLAAYLMTALWLTAWLWLRHVGEDLRRMWVWPLATAVLLWAFYLTFARTVIAVWLAASVVIVTVLFLTRVSARWPQIAVVRSRVRSFVVAILTVSALFAVIMWPTVIARMTISSSDEAVQLRIHYNEEAVASGGFFSWHINWTGVGIGNFTTWLSRSDPSVPSFMYQPAHNIYLMAYSETGLLGLALWIAWLAVIVRAAIRSHPTQPVVRVGICALLAAVLVIGLLDHFYWTLQQGRLLWWATLALAAGRA